jgi:transposase-like zinc ribbon protein
MTEATMSKPLSIQEFMQMFPDDDACLKYLFKARYGAEFACLRCGLIGKFHKLSNMPAYSCQGCGDHIHQMVGTPFYKSHTPLQKWFYAMYISTATRHAVPAKELQRQLSVNYKTARRIGHELRRYLSFVDGDDQLPGHVQGDKTMVGGKRSGFGRS